MRPELGTQLAWLVAAGLAALAWLGYRQPDMAFALIGWGGLCT